MDREKENWHNKNTRIQTPQKESKGSHTWCEMAERTQKWEIRVLNIPRDDPGSIVKQSHVDYIF